MAPAPAGERGQGLLHRLLAVFADQDLGPRLPQDEGDEPLVVWAVLRQENPAFEPNLRGRGRFGPRDVAMASAG